MDHALESSRIIHSLVDLGYGPFFSRQREALGDPLEPARVAASGRGLLEVLTPEGARRATVSGRLLHLSDAAALPTVGDWVGLRPDTGDVAVIDHVFARRTSLARKAAGKRTDAQILAANVDTVMIVTSLNADFNPRRLERYLELALEAGARPVIVLNKADLCDDPASFVEEALTLAPTTPVVPVSALEGAGLDGLRALWSPAETVVLLGSSGVGKSTIANRLLGAEVQKEGAIRESDDRGQHTTTRRELLLLPGGGLLVDTPGIRELAPWAHDEGGPAGFADIESLAAQCRFRDCGHAGEPGCAVALAVESGALAEGRVAGYQKLAGERRYQLDKQDALARAETKRKWKMISKATRGPKT